MIGEIKKEIDYITFTISDRTIESSIEEAFESLEITIKSYIDDVIKEMLDESSNPYEKQLPEANVEIDDILNRHI